MNQMLNLEPVRFLVVEENSNMRSILGNILRTLGVKKVELTSNAVDAFTILKIFKADIIITTWMMDPLDGIEFTQMLRNAPDSNQPMIPIIMLSSFTEKYRIEMARDIGVTEFLAKPVSPRSLYLRIASVILKPRDFVRTKKFFGPDRQRHDDDDFGGTKRRTKDEDLL